VTAIAGISATTLCLYPNLPKETNEMKRIEDFEDFEDFEDHTLDHDSKIDGSWLHPFLRL
jgi:hypothetical protein